MVGPWRKRSRGPDNQSQCGTASFADGFGGQADTLWTMAGIGDLMLTCGSASSRNFQFGQRIAMGESVASAEKAIGTVEGIGDYEGYPLKRI